MKFYMHKLGCPKNDVDADYISARLIDEGHLPTPNPEDADSVIVNTCGFILPAKEESINEILRLGQLKKNGNIKTLYATGCLTQRYGDEMLRDMPELDGAFGHGALQSIAQAVSTSARIPKTIRMESRKLAYVSWTSRYVSDPLPYSYLKISDGCDRMCTYCAIPGMRGKFRSRPLDSILNEAHFLARNGKKELILVSQEATLWGYDLTGRPGVVDLLKALNEMEGIDWIRLMYLYPANLESALIDYMASGTKTLAYYDLPLQHISDPVLQRMRRQVSRDKIEFLLNRIRQTGVPSITRTTFIVGFPGETEAEFDELRDFVGEFAFDRMGVFAYSPEDGTPANAYPDQISDETKAERMDQLMNIQRDIAFDNNLKLVGTTIRCIVDEVDPRGNAVARSWGDCPDIDQTVHLRGDNLNVGDICRVYIESADGYDLLGCKQEPAS